MNTKCYCINYNYFYCKSYLNRYPDLKDTFGNNCKKAYEHWIINGQKENRLACKDIKDFDLESYLERYKDIKEDIGNNFQLAYKHWKEKGQKECRIASKFKKYSIIANCQGIHLNTFLQTNENFKNKFKFIEIKPIHTIDKNEIDYISENIIPNLDLVIIQPIKNGYGNYHKYSTKYLLEKINKDCEVIMFPTIYFSGYFPNIVNFKIDEINMSVHDRNIIKIFNQIHDKKLFVEKCENLINSESFYSCNEISENIQGSLFILKIRENLAMSKYKVNNFIKVSEFIETYYHKVLLFYSLNHFSKHIYRFLSDNILNILKIKKMDYPIDLDPQKNTENMILYKSVKDYINPKLEKNLFSQRGILTENLEKFLEFHFDKYSQVRSKLLKLNFYN